MRAICAAAAVLAGCSQILGIEELGPSGGPPGSDAAHGDAPRDGGPDGPIGPAIKVSGSVLQYAEAGQGPRVVANAQVELILLANGARVASAVSDASGLYSMTVPTQGSSIDGYVAATAQNFVVSRRFFLRPLTGDTNAAVTMIDLARMQSYGNKCSPVVPQPLHTVMLLVVGANNDPVEGAQIQTVPEAAAYCFNDNAGQPAPLGKTSLDGIGWAFGLSFQTQVSAQVLIPGYMPRALPPATTQTLSIVPMGLMQ